jgi:ketosteroid isomerase-like protein
MGHEHNPADEAFNAGDIDATVASYEPQASFVLKSGHSARGVVELREMYESQLPCAVRLFSHNVCGGACPHLNLA